MNKPSILFSCISFPCLVYFVPKLLHTSGEMFDKKQWWSCSSLSGHKTNKSEGSKEVQGLGSLKSWTFIRKSGNLLVTYYNYVCFNWNRMLLLWLYNMSFRLFCSFCILWPVYVDVFTRVKAPETLQFAVSFANKALLTNNEPGNPSMPNNLYTAPVPNNLCPAH